MRLILAIIILCAVARADTKITWLADVTADRAETVTGAQSNQIHDAAAHIVRSDNPHGVTAPQIGAITAELDPVANAALVVHTNRTDNPHNVTAPQIGALTNETDEAALAALAAYAAYWPPNATASSWFTFTTNSGAITITGYNGGVLDVVIPDYINGWPVTEIGANAFRESGVTSIGGAGNVVTVRDSAFYYCISLTSVSLPQVQTVAALAFTYCESLTSVSLPNAQMVGDNAFTFCTSLTSVSLPQVQTVGNSAFSYCESLTSVYFDNHAPTIGSDIFGEITPNQVTIYVTNPTATGWGATLGGMPVVRLPLYADAIYQAGELVATTGYVAQAIAEIPDSIVRGVSVSSTNILVSSTNSVYYVALDNAANIGFDFSALSLGGTKRADITAVIDCLNTQALYSVINTNLVAMDCPWEPTVTGRYELAVSSDGVRTKVVQNSPSMCFFAPALIVVGDLTTTSHGVLFTTLMPSGTLSREIYIANENNPRELAFLRLAMSFNWPEVNGHLSFVCGSGIIGALGEWSSVTNSVYAYPSGVFGYRPAYIPMRPAEASSGFALPTRLVRVIKDVDDSRGTTITSATIRRMNALERAAYNAGSYPAAFRLDY